MGTLFKRPNMRALHGRETLSTLTRVLSEGE